MGIRDGAAIHELLAIPETEVVVSVIAVGHREGYKEAEVKMPRRKELAEVSKFYE